LQSLASRLPASFVVQLTGCAQHAVAIDAAKHDAVSAQ
jgi:hypothetical protein